MKITNDTVLGYARTHGNRPAPISPETTGKASDIQTLITNLEDGNQFYHEALFVEGTRIVYPRTAQILSELSHDGSSTITLEGEGFHLEAIYTDQEQCERFDAPYFDSGELVIAADTLLCSKGGDGYDTPHVEFLSQFGGQTLVLSRKDGDRIGPGWWRVEVLRGPGQ